VRDRRINTAQDIDIGILAQHRGAFDYLKASLPIGGCVLSDVTGAPIEAAFGLPGGGLLDVYWWYRRDGNAYHCYDEGQERRRDGKLSKYHWKGIPETCLYPNPAQKSHVPPLCFAKRRILADDPASVSVDDKDWTYLMPVPEYETDGYVFRLPFGYGAALDHWYPGCWTVPDAQYGTSKFTHDFTVTTCKGVC
jgi:hypothetical protein